MTMRPPVAFMQAPPRTSARSSALLEDKDTRSVLVIEDDKTSATALRIILTRRGCDVTVASSVAEAIEQLEKPPCTVLLDLMLPDGDGLLILERLRQMKSPTKVVVTTSVSDPDHLLAAQHLRPHAILQKPINLVDLFRVMGC